VPGDIVFFRPIQVPFTMKLSLVDQNDRSLPKAPTGIQGLDEITRGGLPSGRPTLVCGSAGCGKTLLAMEFLVRGAMQYGEPGVFMAFEENAAELTQNVRSLGFDLDRLVREKKLVLDFVQVERSEIDETGDYDLEGLFIRLGAAIDSIGAKRVALDTIESCSRDFRTKAFCVPSCAACFAGSRTDG
jgi:circadian clock protein KaiC